ncbi:MAG TPA: SOS response-associated peptidase [Blastocatellia bacterium]|nr:SOS response-associated peptidase [Blastocatellia bacterium]
MCGCIGITSAHSDHAIDLLQIGEIGTEAAPSDRILPSEPVAVVVAEDGARVLDHYKWGFIPAWANDPKKHKPAINARAETVDTSPYFREAFRKRRCLIIATQFYEPYKIPGYKGRVTIRLRSGQMMCLAGVWEEWQGVRRCAIITTPPNEVIEPYHDRAPAILNDTEVDIWLDHSRFDAAELKSLLQPYPSDELEVEVPEVEIEQIQLPL